LGVVLTTPPLKKFLVTKPHINLKKWICEAAKVLRELQSHGEAEEEEVNRSGQMAKSHTVPV
jgi:hypothetical protein